MHTKHVYYNYTVEDRCTALHSYTQKHYASAMLEA